MHKQFDRASIDFQSYWHKNHGMNGNEQVTFITINTDPETGLPLQAQREALFHEISTEVRNLFPSRSSAIAVTSFTFCERIGIGRLVNGEGTKITELCKQFGNQIAGVRIETKG